MAREKRQPLSGLALSGSIVRFAHVRGAGDGEISRLAELQHGHVHLHQLWAAGLKRGAISRRVQSGRLHLVLPRVYLVGRPHSDALGRMMAAALYFRGDAVICGRAAAQAWGMLDTTRQLGESDPIPVALVGRNATPPRRVMLRRVSHLPARDVRWRHGIPLTSPARTILDLASMMDSLDLEAALAAAFARHLVRRTQLDELLARHPRAKGIGALRTLLTQAEPLSDTRSVYERRMLALLAAAELPRPLTNVRVAGKLVDGLWPDLKLAYEFDGWRYHRDRFERDRLRDQDLLIAGHRVMRISRRQVDLQSYALIARIASVITTLRLAG